MFDEWRVDNKHNGNNWWKWVINKTKCTINRHLYSRFSSNLTTPIYKSFPENNMRKKIRTHFSWIFMVVIYKIKWNKNRKKTLEPKNKKTDKIFVNSFGIVNHLEKRFWAIILYLWKIFVGILNLCKFDRRKLTNIQRCEIWYFFFFCSIWLANL